MSLQKSNYIFICEMWLFDLIFPQFCKSDMSRYRYLEPVLMAELDVHPTGDQEVTGSTSIEVGNIFSLDHEIFSTVILSRLLNQEGQLSVSGERMCTILVNCLED